MTKQSRTKRRILEPIVFILMTGGFLVITFSTLLGKPSPMERPNIILLVADDQRWDTLGSSGNRIIETPHLDLLAHRGVFFENAFVTTSICASSRASIFTGQYARRHGIWDFQTDLSPSQLSKSYLGVLKTAGYQIAFVGKWGVGKPPSQLLDYDRSFAGQGKYFTERDGRQRHLTALMADDAIEFLEQAEEARPFCLSISFKAPHVQDSYNIQDEPFPFDPELAHLYSQDDIVRPVTAETVFFDRLPDFLKNSEARLRWAIRFWGPQRFQESVKGYYRLISGIDRAVGRILDKLEELNLQETTVILFTSDNGFYLGEKGLAGKWFAHEESIRVPLIVSDPRRKDNAGSRHTQMALNVDVAPTILELAGVEVPESMQGRSLLPVLNGDTEGWREEFFYEHLFRHPRIPVSEAIRTSHWKYIRYAETDPPYEELYHLEEDPSERNNLASKPEYSTKLEDLRRRWKAWRGRVQ